MDEIIKIMLDGNPGPIKEYLARLLIKSAKDMIEGYRENPVPQYGVTPNAALFLKPMMKEINDYHARLDKLFDVELQDIIVMTDDEEGHDKKAYTAAEAFYDMYYCSNRYVDLKRKTFTLPTELKGEIDGLFKLLDNWFAYNYGDDDRKRNELEEIYPQHVISLYLLKALYELENKVELAVQELDLVEKMD